MQPGRNLIFCSLVMVFAPLFLGISTASGLAKGPFSKITVRGGELTSEIEVTDPALLGFGSLMSIPNALNPAPQVTGEGYLITRYGQDSNGQYIAWDSLRYYPAAANGRGYVYYVGLINGSSEYDGHWFNAVPSGETAIREILDNKNASFPGQDKSLLLLSLGLGVLATIALVVRIRRSKNA